MDELTKKTIEGKQTQPQKVQKTQKVQKPQSEPQEPQKPQLDNQENIVKLGDDKIIEITPWTGKTKKLMRKEFENISGPQDIDFANVMEILLYNHIKQDDVYLNNDEQKYLLARIAKISIDEKIIGKGTCEHCESENEMVVNINEDTKYSENRLPQKSNVKDFIEYVDIKSYTEFKDIVDEYLNDINYDGVTTALDIEFAMRLEFDEPKTLQERIDWLDNEPVVEIQKINDDINQYMPKCNITKHGKCKICGNPQDFDLEIAEEVFKTLLS